MPAAAQRWLELATTADMAGEGKKACAARDAVAGMMQEMFLYAEHARWPFPAHAATRRVAHAPTARLAHRDERQPRDSNATPRGRLADTPDFT